MRVYERLTGQKQMFYDDVDIRNAYRSGFNIGAVSGAVSVFVICLLLGLFLVT